MAGHHKKKAMSKLLTPYMFTKEMKRVFEENREDKEGAHSKADELLCQALEALGYKEGIAIYNSVEKWCG